MLQPAEPHRQGSLEVLGFIFGLTMEPQVASGWGGMCGQDPSLQVGQWDPEAHQCWFGPGSCGPRMDAQLGGSAGERKAVGLWVEGGAEFVGPPTPLCLWLPPQAIYKLKKACRGEGEAGQQGQLLTPEEVVDRIFLLVDTNGDGRRGRGGGPSVAPPLPGRVTWEDPSASQLVSSSSSWVCRGRQETAKGVSSP